MPQATVLLAAASGLVEGALCPNGKTPSTLPVTRLAPKGEGFGAGIAALAQTAKWESVAAVIVVATEAVGFRKLAFPFNDARRIRQSLRYALESELLEDVGMYAVDHDLVPENDGAQVLVSLLKQAALQSLLDTSAQSGLQTYRVLSAAHALLAAAPPASPNHVQIYVGAEEAFLTVVKNGRIDQIVALPSALPSALGELAEQGITTADGIFTFLSGETDESRVNRSLLRTRLQNELQEIVTLIGRFLRVQPLPPGTTYSVHGLYAPWFVWDIDQGTVSLVNTPRARSGPPRKALGILHELQLAPDGVLSEKGPGFFRAASSWRSILLEVKRPAIACGVLLLLAMAVATGTYLTSTVSLLRQIDRTNQDLQAIIAKRVGANVPESARLSVLREQLASLKEQSRVAARTVSVPYAVLGTFADVSTQAATVPGVTVETVQVNSNQITVAGQSPTFQAAEALRDHMGNMARFKGKTAKLSYQRAGQAITYRIIVQ